MSENFDHKLALVAEGHQILSEKLEQVESSLVLKIDRVTTEITAHRADTEAHHGVYLVKES